MEITIYIIGHEIVDLKPKLPEDQEKGKSILVDGLKFQVEKRLWIDEPCGRDKGGRQGSSSWCSKF